MGIKQKYLSGILLAFNERILSHRAARLTASSLLSEMPPNQDKRRCPLEKSRTPSQWEKTALSYFYAPLT